MKKYIIKPAAIKQVFCFIILIFSLSSCEDVIDVELDTAAPRLVVEASIDWEKGTDGSYQKIKLTTTTDYFGTEIPTVSNAIVSITNLNSGQIFTFLDKATIEELIEKHRQEPHLRLLQKKLAEEITVFVHSQEQYEKV